MDRPFKALLKIEEIEKSTATKSTDELNFERVNLPNFGEVAPVQSVQKWRFPSLDFEQSAQARFIFSLIFNGHKIALVYPRAKDNFYTCIIYDAQQNHATDITG